MSIENVKVLWYKNKEQATFEINDGRNVIFEGESNLADTFIGWGIVDSLKEKGRVNLVVSSEDEVILPRKYRIK